MLNKTRRFVFRIRGEVATNELVKHSLRIGNRLEHFNQVIIDDSNAWLIMTGDDVTLAPRMHNWSMMPA